MDLNLRSYPEQHLPDWPAAATAGFASGAVLMVLEMFWSALVSASSPWLASHMVAAIVLGPQTLQSPDFNLDVVAVALAAHYFLGIVFGLLLAAIMAPLRLDSSVALTCLAGVVFGAALYLVNFYAMTRFFPWFIDWRGNAALLAHLIFGVTAALLYSEMNRYH